MVEGYAGVWLVLQDNSEQDAVAKVNWVVLLLLGERIHCACPTMHPYL